MLAYSPKRRYSAVVMFSDDLEHVLLIHKLKPCRLSAARSAGETTRHGAESAEARLPTQVARNAWCRGRAVLKKAVALLETIWAKQPGADGYALAGILALLNFDLMPGTTQVDRAANRIVGAGLIWEAIKMLRDSTQHSAELNGVFRGMAQGAKK